MDDLDYILKEEGRRSKGLYKFETCKESRYRKDKNRISCKLDCPDGIDFAGGCEDCEKYERYVSKRR